jgi:hypothetical protein
MGSFSDFWEDELLDHVMMKGVYTPPTIWIGLSTADPTDDASGLAEPGGGSYARVETAAGDWNVAGSRATSNANDITFPTAEENWGTITHIAGFDAATDGNMLFHDQLAASQAIDTDDTFVIPAGDLDVSFAAGGINDFLANELLDHAFGKGAYTPATNIYVALSTADPTDDGSGLTEPSTSYGYDRVSTSGATWDPASAGALDNAAAITFPECTGTAWGTITHVQLMDADSPATANCLIYSVLGASKVVNVGNTFKFPIGNVDVSLT